MWAVLHAIVRTRRKVTDAVEVIPAKVMSIGDFKNYPLRDAFRAFVTLRDSKPELCAYFFGLGAIGAEFVE